MVGLGPEGDDFVVLVHLYLETDVLVIVVLAVHVELQGLVVFGRGDGVQMPHFEKFLDGLFLKVLDVFGVEGVGYFGAKL